MRSPVPSAPVWFVFGCVIRPRVSTERRHPYVALDTSDCSDSPLKHPALCNSKVCPRVVASLP